MKKQRRLCYEIRKLSQLFHQCVEKNTAGLTRMQCFLIGYMEEREAQGIDTYQKDIEKEFRITRPTASQTLSLMEEKGLIFRLEVEHDRRLRKLVLSPASLERAKDMKARIMAEEKALFDLFTPEEKELFFSYFDRMANYLEDNNEHRD